MSGKHSDGGASLEERMQAVEHLAAAYAHDQTGWLIALQAIVAVGVVRQVSGGPDPKRALADWEGWARQIVRATEIPASAKHLDTESFRERAMEKLSIFFSGINVSPR